MLPRHAMSNEAIQSEGPRATIELPGGESITVPLPAGEVPAYAVLPALRALVDAMMQRVKDASAARGETITCRAGCGACCRQYVPISDMEARALVQLLASMPEDRQARVRARFAEAEARLREAGLWDRLAQGGRMRASEHRPISEGYFHLGIPCPFLEDEACSIHPSRPLICREYLVVSPSIHCAKLERKEIKRLPAPQTSTALHVMDGTHEPDHYNVFPLVAALEWLRRHPEEPERATAEAWINYFGQAMQYRFGDSVEMMSRPPPEASEEW
jgi:Fe-S-cluster containining protein